jgi:hypothetical protein
MEELGYTFTILGTRCPGLFTRRKRPSKICLDAVEKRKITFPCRESNRDSPNRPACSQSTELSQHLLCRLINLNFESKVCIAWLRKVYSLCNMFGPKQGEIHEELMILYKKELRHSCRLSREVRAVKCGTSKQADRTCSRERREERRTEFCYKTSW